jgi:hypothetical protein
VLIALTNFNIVSYLQADITSYVKIYTIYVYIFFLIQIPIRLYGTVLHVFIYVISTLVLLFFLLTPCHQATRKLVIALPCIVDGSRVSSFPYAAFCTCVCQLVWRSSSFKVIDSLMQDVRSQVTNKQTGSDPMFSEPEDCNKVTTHSDTLSVYIQLQSWLCVEFYTYLPM